MVPAALGIDQFDGSAWIGVTPFWMSGVTLRRWPALPGLSRFPELNVRTYVTLGDQPGVWFFSLDAGNRVAVWVARRLYRLPYVYARMAVRRSAARIEYRSARPAGGGFEATYQPVGPPAPSARGTLEHFLTERYYLYAFGGDRVYRARIHHEPWQLHPAAAGIRRNDMLQLHGIPQLGPPATAHYAARMDVVVWALRPTDD